MMAAKHTSEPWRWSEDSNWVELKGKDGPVCCFDVDKRGRSDAPLPADRTRIIACINACAGINPEALPDFLRAFIALLDCAERLEVRVPDMADMPPEIMAARAAWKMLKG
jgi:hypothetical protein